MTPATIKPLFLCFWKPGGGGLLRSIRAQSLQAILYNIYIHTDKQRGESEPGPVLMENVKTWHKFNSSKMSQCLKANMQANNYSDFLCAL